VKNQKKKSRKKHQTSQTLTFGAFALAAFSPSLTVPLLGWTKIPLATPRLMARVICFEAASGLTI